MRLALRFGGAVVLVTALLIGFMAYNNVSAVSAAQKPMHIILVGASIGQGWHLEGWSQRVGARDMSAEAIAAWQFDKTEALDEVLMRPKRKVRITRTYLKGFFQPPLPSADVVILKECSSYFPGDLEQQKRSVRNWVEAVRSRGKRVMLATVVPVTRERAARNPGKQEALLAYNRWVREYALEQRIPVLDLEAAMRDNTVSGFLRDEYDSGDGSHLNAAAYKVLDQALVENLKSFARPAAVASR